MKADVGYHAGGYESLGKGSDMNLVRLSSINNNRGKFDARERRAATRTGCFTHTIHENLHCHFFHESASKFPVPNRKVCKVILDGRILSRRGTDVFRGYVEASSNLGRNDLGFGIPCSVRVQDAQTNEQSAYPHWSLRCLQKSQTTTGERVSQTEMTQWGVYFATVCLHAVTSKKASRSF